MYEKIGTAHGLKGEHELCIENLEKSLEHSKNNPLVVANLANSYIALGNVEKAIESCQQCLEEHSHFAPLHSTLCFAFSKNSVWDRAIHHGEMALGLDKNFQPDVVYHYLSKAYLETGNQEKSKEYQEKLNEILNQDKEETDQE